MTLTVPNAPSGARVALVAYVGVQDSAVLGLGDVLNVANRFAGQAEIAPVAHQTLRLGDLTDGTQFDAVVLPPNLSGARGREDGKLVDWIAAQHRDGATLCSACAGAFWLGRAGVLDGRPVTTHWALEDEFRTAFPRAMLHPEHR